MDCSAASREGRSLQKDLLPGTLFFLDRFAIAINKRDAAMGHKALDCK